MNALEQSILNKVAERQFATGKTASLATVRASIMPPPMDEHVRTSVDKALAGLEKIGFLEKHTEAGGLVAYALTVDGWMASRFALQAEKVMSDMLHLYQSKVRAGDAEFPPIPWTEVQQAAQVGDDLLHLYIDVSYKVGLTNGSCVPISAPGFKQVATFSRPNDLDEIVNFKTSAEVLDWRRRKALRRRALLDDSQAPKPRASKRHPASGPRLAKRGAPRTDDDFMALAIAEAAKAKSEKDQRPHPSVGAVVVMNGRVIAKSHRGEGQRGRHAEFVSLEKKLARRSLVGATLYTTLEPCTTRNHPKVPCARRVTERQFTRVVIGMLDPDPRITGKGFRLLGEAGISTEILPTSNRLAKKIVEMNRDWIRSYTDVPRMKAGSASGDAKILCLMAQQFDRPAFYTPFQGESSLPDFKQAITDTILALSTGVRRTRDGAKLASIPSRHDVKSAATRAALAKVERSLAKLRTQFDAFLRAGKIRRCGCGKPDCSTFTIAPLAAREMDRLRGVVLELFRAVHPAFDVRVGK